MTKAELDNKKSIARSLFLSGMEQAEIAERVAVSRNTVSKWCADGHWKEQRAAKTVTRAELVNQVLNTIHTLLEQADLVKDPAAAAGLADKLVKLSAVIEKLDKKANVIDAIEVFMAFSRWLEFRAQSDPNVTPELVKAINHLQDQYLTESLTKGALA